MSLIIDALKKAQSSKDKKEVETKEISGDSSGMFKPQPILASSPKGGSNKLRVVFMAIFALIGLVVVSFYSYNTYFNAPVTNASIAKPIISIDNTKKSQPTAKEKDDEDNKKQAQVAKLRNLAVVFYQNGKFNDSVNSYMELTNLDPANPENYNNYGVALKKVGKIKKAKQAYNTALALNPDYPEALNNLAVIEMAERQYNNARRRLTKAIEINPDYLDPYLHLALCLEKIGDVDNAITYYQSFLEMSEGKVTRKLRLQIENRLVRLNEDIQ